MYRPAALAEDDAATQMEYAENCVGMHTNVTSIRSSLIPLIVDAEATDLFGSSRDRNNK